MNLKLISFFIIVTVFAINAQSEKVLTVLQNSNNEIVSVVDNKFHFDYGLIYPITYQIGLSENRSNLRAFTRESKEKDWIKLEEKTTDDFFNGIDAVRFDYENAKAFISVTFAQLSDSIFIKIVNEFGEAEEILYNNITKYYDNRDAVVTSTADDWADYSDFKFVQCCRAFRKRKLWLSTGIITNLCSSSTWSNIQNQIDLGYVEAIAHSRNHPHTPYSDYDSEIEGCKNDIIDQLDLPAQFRLYDKEYVYIWIAPFGDYDDIVDSVVAANKYLASRLYYTDYHKLADWNENRGMFSPFGVSLEIGPTEIDGQPWMGTNDITILNSTFDSISTSGGIYHPMIHPNTDVYTKNYFYEHLEYISGRNNIWYVATGHLYLYHILKDNAQPLVNVASSNYQISERVILKQNYPNPFNPSTKISYHIKNNDRIKLRIYNSLGEIITTLVDKLQSAGTYTYSWDASNVSSGLYFYVLEGRSFRLAKKMLLIR
jgi:hypothetical protein